MDDRVARAIDLLAHLEHESLPLAAVVDRIELVTTDPHRIRTVLDEADRRGLIDREDGIVRPKSRQFVRFGEQVVSREGEFSCERCGSSLGTGYFIVFDSGEVGPFGSSCIRKVTGRE